MTTKPALQQVLKGILHTKDKTHCRENMEINFQDESIRVGKNQTLKQSKKVTESTT
jgi:hypothetical protein